jgi:hypothetical protein
MKKITTKAMQPGEEIPAPKGPKVVDKPMKKESYKDIMLSMHKKGKK